MSIWSHFPIRNAYFPYILPGVLIRKVATKYLCVCAQGASLTGDAAVGTGREFCSLSSQQMIQEHTITMYPCSPPDREAQKAILL